MTDHLPECDAHNGVLDCICPALRACEARVRTEEALAYTDAVIRTHPTWNAYAAGLDAARDAVERAYEKDSPTVQYGTVPGVAVALAVIDALRGEA